MHAPDIGYRRQSQKDKDQMRKKGNAKNAAGGNMVIVNVVAYEKYA